MNEFTIILIIFIITIIMLCFLSTVGRCCERCMNDNHTGDVFTNELNEVFSPIQNTAKSTHVEV